MAAPLRITIGLQETPIRNIYIYNGSGVYGESVDKLERLFNWVKGPWEISRVGAAEVLPETWDPNKTLFILPGGKAGEYDEHLGSKVGALQNFVKEGGFFYSVCGGSYFASRRTVYQLSSQERIERERPLRFFKGTAEGPLIPSNSDDIAFHHGALQIRWKDSGDKAPVLVSGGGGFIPLEGDKSYSVLASFDDPSVPERLSAAIVKCNVGKGTAILSSLHLGYNASDIDLPAYTKYFPDHNWKKIVEDLNGTEKFRAACFASLIRSFT